jgi:hypothetical protein
MSLTDFNHCCLLDLRVTWVTLWQYENKYNVAQFYNDERGSDDDDDGYDDGDDNNDDYHCYYF